MVDATEQSKIVELIRRCLALSESSNEHEAAAAAAKAQELLAKYNIDMAQVSMASGKGPEVMKDYMHVQQAKPGTSSHWKIHLATVVGQANYCTVLTSAKKVTWLTFVGQTHNVAVTKEMFGWLVETLERIADAKTAEVRKDPMRPQMRKAANFRRFHKSFLFGAVAGVKDALDAQRRKMAAEMKAVVLVNDQAVQAFIDTNIVFAKRSYKQYDPGDRGWDYEGHRAGVEAGRRVPLNRARGELNGGQ